MTRARFAAPGVRFPLSGAAKVSYQAQASVLATPRRPKVTRFAITSLSSLMRAVALAVALVPVAGAALAEDAYFVQLASVKSAERASKAWAELQAKHAELLGDLELTVRSIDVAGRGTFYRIQTGPFPNRTTAEDMCQQLRAAKLECLIAQR